ncbi:hypothetical protein Salat_0137100 [Sesamum alatum]|uniref:Myb/SANT-like domain-containing protein n=1 Tax=Sesamum alatum TaxID=300844 RepID=A0AAE1YWE3_9LAMI|nr:hypothetical protein Salat_0137100 [Sesamum alatum]
MWPDGFYYQEQMFYNSRWTKEVEKTFVDSLVTHVQTGFFRPGCPNIHAVMCVLYDVNKKYKTRITYEWAQTRVASLRKIYELFHWVVNSEGVIWNNKLGKVTAPDHVWRRLRWADHFDLNVPAHDVGWVEAHQHHEGQAAFLAEGNVVVPAEEMMLYRLRKMTEVLLRVMLHSPLILFKSDPDSVLPPPEVPHLTVKMDNVPHVSPPSQKSAEATSSTASSLTPLKKET